MKRFATFVEAVAVVLSRTYKYGTGKLLVYKRHIKNKIVYMRALAENILLQVPYIYRPTTAGNVYLNLCKIHI